MAQAKDCVSVILGDICSLRRGVSYTGKDLTDDAECFPMINLKSFSKQGTYRPEGIKFHRGGFKEKNLITQDDIVLANTDLTQEGDILGAAILLPQEYHGRDVIGSHHTTILSVCDDRILPEYLVHLLNSKPVRLQVRRYRRGATVKGITSGDLLRLKLIFPPIEEQELIVEILNRMRKTMTEYRAMGIGIEKAMSSFVQDSIESYLEVNE